MSESAGPVDSKVVQIESTKSPESNLVECFSCKACWLTILDVLFCWPRWLCKCCQKARFCREGDCYCGKINCSSTCSCGIKLKGINIYKFI